jgi:hypothetical protein
MNRLSSFDPHAAESAAQVAAIWFVLKALMRHQLKSLTGAERAAYLDRMVKASETITLPSTNDQGSEMAGDWIAHRYWQLIAEFAEQVSEPSGRGHHAPH